MSVGLPPLKESWAKTMSSETYKKASDTMKKIMIKQVHSQYKTRNWQIMMSTPDVMQEFNERRTDRQKGIFGRGNN